MITIDLEAGIVSVEEQGQTTRHRFDSPEAFAAVSRAWLRVGWDTRYVYSFTWLGRPIIQLPEDMMRLQEVIYNVKPDLIIETGIAHGGGLVFYASLCKAMGKGRVLGVDIDIRSHNRTALEAHELAEFITLIEGSSVDSVTLDHVRSFVRDGETVLVLLDSSHTKEHVLAELQAYSKLVTPGSYIVAMDGIMGELPGAPRTQPDWTWNNPRQAALEFVENHPDFIIEEPAFRFNEGNIRARVTYWPSAFIKRLSHQV